MLDKYMDKILTFEEITEILKTGDFDKLVSQRESEIFEAKAKKPYDFSKRKAIIEFVKDVASLANNKGGYIVCGLGTKKPQNSPHDYVKSLDLIVKNSFYSEAQLVGIVTSNIHPKLSVSVKWYPYKDNNNIGLWTILIPEQEESKKHFIIKVTEVEDEATREFFGIPIRTDDDTKWLTVQELHTLSKRSPNSFQKLDQSITTQIDGVKEMIASLPRISAVDTDSIPAKVEETIYGNQ